MVQRDRPTQILLIEDSPGDSWLIADILMSGPIPKKILTISEGARALRYLRGLGEFAGSVLPDLVLLDLNLPGTTGLEVLRQIKSDPALRTLTVIVLTTSDATTDINAAYDLNANCYVVKPMDLNEFTQAIRGIEDFWLRVALLPGAGTQRYPRASAQDASASDNGPVASFQEDARLRFRMHARGNTPLRRRSVRRAARRGRRSISLR